VCDLTTSVESVNCELVMSNSQCGHSGPSSVRAYIDVMTNNLHRWPTVAGDEAVLIIHADCDTGYVLARDLLASGRRAVVTARHVTALTRILLGRSASEVMAIAADVDDPAQRARLIQRAEARFGHIAWVVDGRSGMLTRNTGVVESAAA
jgi:hypothetical protein